MGRLYNGDENEDENENREKGHLTINDDITHASIVLVIVIVLVTAPQ